MDLAAPVETAAPAQVAPLPLAAARPAAGPPPVQSVPRPGQPDLPELVVRSQRRDLDAFEALVLRFQDMAYAYAFARVGDFHLAQDVAQEAFVEAFFALPRLRHAAAFPRWLRLILLKHSDRFTRGSRLVTISIQPGDERVADSADPQESDPSAITERREGELWAHRALASLPARERVVAMLFYAAGYSYAELAAFLGLPLSTVKKRLHDARQRLRARFGTGAALAARGTPRAARALRGRPPSRTTAFSAVIRLYLAVQTQRIDQVRKMLAADPGLAHARHVGARQEELAVLQLFAGPQPGSTPLHWAARLGTPELVSIFVRCGADIEARNRTGETPLHIAAVLGNSAAVALLAHGADPAATANAGITALHRAAMRGHVDVAEALLTHGAHVDAVDVGGRAALDWAARNGHTAVVSVLRRHGARAIHEEKLR